jgi:hypothetical protein
MRGLLWGILFIILVGVGGLVYRNAAEHPNQPIACPLDAKVCPDGTTLARTGASCTFPACPPPNVSLAGVHIAYAVPAGFVPFTAGDPTVVASYQYAATTTATVATTTAASSTPTTNGWILIRQYPISASSTPETVIRQTAVGGASGLPVPVTALSSADIGGRQYTVAAIERFEGNVDTAYYLVRGSDVLRFDAVDAGVAGWTDAQLAVDRLPAHAALIALLAHLQVLQ